MWCGSKGKGKKAEGPGQWIVISEQERRREGRRKSPRVNATCAAPRFICSLGFRATRRPADALDSRRCYTSRMPFSPSDFAWWVWILFGAGAALVWGVCFLITVGIDEKNGGAKFFFGLVTFVVGLAGAACILIALIRFVKWVWES